MTRAARCQVSAPKRFGQPLMPETALRLMARVLVLCALLHVRAAAEEPTSGYLEPEVTPEDREHWSFRPVAVVDVPPAPPDSTPRNDVDHFIGARLHEHGLSLQPEASRRTLIRRLHLDLHGLPPSPEAIRDFVSQTDDRSWEDLVDRLLSSPHYGERWAQFWLDLARFAETDGFEFDKERPNAWSYRDWVIQALNDDMPYDEFVRQQIAGDELYPGSDDALTATRFCLSGPDMPDINLIEERRHTLLNEIVSTVSESILGLQVGCAQCHDHKYDPISQGDFYRLRATFEPSVQLQKNKSISVLREQFPYKQTSCVMLRGDFRRPGPELKPGVIRVLNHENASYAPTPTQQSAGLRSALAKWLVDTGNPLTARVIVNRVWQHHFGRGIVSSPSEFGIIGEEPSHSGLLDFLAGRLMEQGWSLKALHRLIVTSAVYRQRSMLPDEASLAEQARWQAALLADPDAILLSRYPRWRLEGEAIRDAMLTAAGRLNFKTGGPGVRPPLPEELLDTLPQNHWTVTPDPSEHDRRSIYVFARRNLRYPMFEAFDRPMANSSCPQRHVSTTAPQSLYLLNSEFSLQAARHMAAHLIATTPALSEQIDAAFERTLGRSPTPEEQADVVRFLHRQDPHDSETPLTHLCLSLFNCNEFVFVD